jgi:hypothetical protein
MYNSVDRPPIIKDYKLVLKDSKRQQHLIDEGNGIILDAQVFEHLLVSLFDVQGSILFINYMKIDQHTFAQEIYAGKKAIDSTEAVARHPISNLQRMRLYRN